MFLLFSAGKKGKNEDRGILSSRRSSISSSKLSFAVGDTISRSNSSATSAAFSLASFFLFLAVLPLMYAPETLSEKRIREMELKNYLEKAKKVKEKYA